MKDQRLYLKDIIQHIDSATLGRLNVPEIQRRFVWTPEKFKKFVDSLWREYPVGVILLWEAEYNQPQSAFGGTGDKQWIVDGQQRVTSLALLFGSKPYWWESASEWNDYLERYDVLVNIASPADALEFALPNPVRKKAPEWVSVRSILSSGNLSELAQELGKKVTTMEFAALHERLQSVRKLEKFPMYEIVIDHDPEDVAEIFSRLNTAGTKIRESDVIIALVASKQLGWVRENFNPFLKGLADKGFELDPSVVIRTLATLGGGTARLRDVSKGFWEKSGTFDNAWRETTEAISYVQRKMAEAGVLSSDLLPAHNVLIPAFALYARFKSDFRFPRTLKWLLRATRDGRYSGAAITTLDQDTRLLGSCSSFDEAVGRLTDQLQASDTYAAEDFQRDYRDGFLQLVQYLAAFQSGAKDWLCQEVRIGFDRADNQLNEGFKPEWHHFFPRALLRSQYDALKDVAANVVVLNEKANRSFNSKPPKDYLSSNAVAPERLKEQVVPTESKLWELASFAEFVAVRAGMLAASVNSMVAGLS